MLIDFPTYINMKCKVCRIATLHRTFTGYPDIPNKSKDDHAECIACGNSIILDDWYREYIGRSGMLISIE